MFQVQDLGFSGFVVDAPEEDHLRVPGRGGLEPASDGNGLEGGDTSAQFEAARIRDFSAYDEVRFFVVFQQNGDIGIAQTVGSAIEDGAAGLIQSQAGEFHVADKL